VATKFYRRKAGASISSRNMDSAVGEAVDYRELIQQMLDAHASIHRGQ
jgi:hypothetical protein